MYLESLFPNERQQSIISYVITYTDDPGEKHTTESAV